MYKQRHKQCGKLKGKKHDEVKWFLTEKTTQNCLAAIFFSCCLICEWNEYANWTYCLIGLYKGDR